MDEPLLQSQLPFPVRRGKVRDVYDLGDRLLIVATDRISAFDCIMPNGIPGKGKILTALSQFWFEKFAGAFPNHILSVQPEEHVAELQPFAGVIAGRSMLVKRAQVVPVECVARGYLAGSGWSEYAASGVVCGERLPKGLRQADALPTPIFTPATKEESGHDINISFEQAAVLVGAETAAALKEQTLSLYSQATAYARTKGVIIADTKLEFGFVDGKLILVDEVLTPDSSRFWPLDGYEPGRDQPSFDKQFVRNWLQTQAWDRCSPAPALPQDVVAGTLRRYVEAYERLTERLWAR